MMPKIAFSYFDQGRLLPLTTLIQRHYGTCCPMRLRWSIQKAPEHQCIKDTLCHCFLSSHVVGEICGFRIHGAGTPFEAVVLDRTTGEGLIRAKGPVDCEAQREHTFTIQAHDCGEGPDGANSKKSHK